MLVILMGVSGSGKTTIGEALSERTGWPFEDADAHHPPENVAKMRANQPLTDEDRWPWLDRLNGLLRGRAEAGRSVILGCSALKRAYREALERDLPEAVHWVHLRGSFDLIADRMQARDDHFMPPGLLRSQFDTLEPPTGVITIDIDGAIDEAIDAILRELPTVTD